MDNGNGELALVKILRIQDRKLSFLLEWPKCICNHCKGTVISRRDGHDHQRFI